MSQNEKAGGIFHRLFHFVAFTLQPCALNIKHSPLMLLHYRAVLYEFIALRVFLDYIGQITVFGFYCLDFRVFRSYNVKAFYACAKQHTTL